MDNYTSETREAILARDRAERAPRDPALVAHTVLGTPQGGVRQDGKPFQTWGVRFDYSDGSSATFEGTGQSGYTWTRLGAAEGDAT